MLLLRKYIRTYCLCVVDGHEAAAKLSIIITAAMARVCGVVSVYLEYTYIISCSI